MPHDPGTRPKRPRDPFKAAHEIFREVIGEKPRITPTQNVIKPVPKSAPKKAPKAPR